MLLALVLIGCARGRTVSVRVSVTGADSAESPVPGVVLTAVPFDRDSLLLALARRAGTAAPDTTGLDSLLLAYRAPFAALTAASARVSALRDSVATAGPPDTTRLRAALTDADARVREARRRIDLAQASGGDRLDSIRKRMATWENSTYADYESVATGRMKATGRSLLRDTTGADGWAHVRLPAGDWWIYATSWDVGDPNRYWYWNAHVTGDSLRFDSHTGVRRPRF